MFSYKKRKTAILSSEQYKFLYIRQGLTLSNINVCLCSEDVIT